MFLDTNIILQALSGRIRSFFDDDARARFTYAINPVVLQELLLSVGKQDAQSRFDEFVMGVKVLPINAEKTKDLLSKLKEIRNRAVHSNDLLIASSASECDYFVTDDVKLQAQFKNENPRVLSSADFQKLLGEHRP